MHLSGFLTAQEASEPLEVSPSESQMEKHQPLEISQNSDALLQSLLKRPDMIPLSGLTLVQVESMMVESRQSKDHLSSCLVNPTRKIEMDMFI